MLLSDLILSIIFLVIIIIVFPHLKWQQLTLVNYLPGPICGDCVKYLTYPIDKSIILNVRERGKKMSKKKNQKVLIISSMEIWEMRKPRYDGFACGHGAHGNKGYNRRKVKEQFRREEW